MRVLTTSGNTDCRRIDLGEVAIGDAVMQPGFRWNAVRRPCPAPNNRSPASCALRHIGMVIEGHYRWEMADEPRSTSARARPTTFPSAIPTKRAS